MPPTVTAVTPTSGGTGGGTTVTVTGTNLTGATSVTFGGTAGTGLVVGSATSLTVTSPAHAAGVVDVLVSTPGGTSAASASAKFQYVVPGGQPVVEEIAPASGPTDTGVAVTVRGSGFTGATAVNFGAVAATSLTVVDDTELMVTSPPQPAGQVDLRVVTPAGISAVVPEDQFTYVTRQSRAMEAPLPSNADPDPGALLNAVDCPAIQQCMAVGGYSSENQRIPLAEQQIGASSWQYYQIELPSDAAADADVDLQDVDCSSPTHCVAIGTYRDDTFEFFPLIETWDGESWTPSSVAVPDSGFTEETTLSDVDCPTADLCVAVGRYDDSVTFEDVPLVLEISAGTVTLKTSTPAVATGQLWSVDCPTASSCIAVGDKSDAGGLVTPLILAGPTSWSVASTSLPGDVASADPRASLDSVSCSGAGNCAAAGSYFTSNSKTQGLLQVLASPSTTWTPLAAPAPAGAATNPQVQLRDVSCPAAGTCAVVGDYRVTGNGLRPLLVRLSGTTPTITQGAVPADAQGSPSGSESAVACSSAQHCLGVGFYDVDLDQRAPLLSRLNNTTWSPLTGPRPDDLILAQPQAIAIDGPVGVGVGYYVDSESSKALIMLDLPVSP
ncbi:MAG TPA: IPT/TIG domain-containing protein [Nocardioides sp.]|nr:IPT/TIG domain-containing protein [Nocardioides sp.]